MLNPISAGMNCPVGRPNSARTVAKPSPCNKPNPKTSAVRHLLSLEKKIFSTATKTIDAAIKGSTIDADILITPTAPAISVNVWANVKAEICHKRTEVFKDNKNKPKTNKI